MISSQTRFGSQVGIAVGVTVAVCVGVGVRVRVGVGVGLGGIASSTMGVGMVTVTGGGSVQAEKDMTGIKNQTEYRVVMVTSWRLDSKSRAGESQGDIRAPIQPS